MKCERVANIERKIRRYGFDNALLMSVIYARNQNLFKKTKFAGKICTLPEHQPREGNHKGFHLFPFWILSISSDVS